MVSIHQLYLVPSDTVTVTAFTPSNSLTANGLVADISSLTIEFYKSSGGEKPDLKYRYLLANR